MMLVPARRVAEFKTGQESEELEISFLHYHQLFVRPTSWCVNRDNCLRTLATTAPPTKREKVIEEQNDETFPRINLRSH